MNTMNKPLEELVGWMLVTRTFCMCQRIQQRKRRVSVPWKAVCQLDSCSSKGPSGWTATARPVWTKLAQALHLAPHRGKCGGHFYSMTVQGDWAAGRARAIRPGGIVHCTGTVTRIDFAHQDGSVAVLSGLFLQFCPSL
jgi:hypothetical protein